MTPLPRRAAKLVLAATAITALAACTAPEPTSPPSPPAATQQPNPTPSPSPSPTAPEGAPFGWQPTWTDAQTGAAHIVDAHLTLVNQICHHSHEVPYYAWAAVTTDPEYTKRLRWHQYYSSEGFYATGDVTVDWRTVSEERTADNGRQEVVVTQCEDGSGMTGFAADGQARPPDPVNLVPDRNVVVYTVQFVDTADDWRVADRLREEQCRKSSASASS